MLSALHERRPSVRLKKICLKRNEQAGLLMGANYSSMNVSDAES